MHLLVEAEADPAVCVCKKRQVEICWRPRWTAMCCFQVCDFPPEMFSFYKLTVVVHKCTCGWWQKLVYVHVCLQVVFSMFIRPPPEVISSLTVSTGDENCHPTQLNTRGRHNCSLSSFGSTQSSTALAFINPPPTHRFDFLFVFEWTLSTDFADQNATENNFLA